MMTVLRTGFVAVTALVWMLLPASCLPHPKFSRPPDPYQPYVGQTTCDPTPKPGVLDFRDMVRAMFPETRDSGVIRACHLGGRSEHKEGRAWDWGVSVSNERDRQAVNAVISWLTATRQGEPNAYARRMGLMYMIWNRQIWRSYPQAGCPAGAWGLYMGDNPHTDHMHFSFSWPGARRETTWWASHHLFLPLLTFRRN